MYRMTILLIQPLLFFLLSASPVIAEIDWELWNTIKVPGTPVDVAILSKSDRLFVLTEKGDLQIYFLQKDQWKTIKIDQEPLALTASSRGKQILVLTKGGQILIYDQDGKFLEKKQVDPSVKSIRMDPGGKVLFLTDSKNRTVQIVLFDLVRQNNITGSPYQGISDAPVVIVEFSEFECIYCKRLKSVLNQVLELYPDQVKVVFKNFPLKAHENSLLAAQAALAAERQNKFWEFHDQLFDNVDKLNQSRIFEIAEELNLNMVQFRKDLQSREITLKINTDYQEGLRAGVQGVPSVFINGRRLKQRSIESFAQMIEEELSKTGGNAKPKQ